MIWIWGIVVFVLLFLAYGCLSNRKLEVNYHTLQMNDKLGDIEGLRILHLSDLHGCRFGIHNEQLIRKVQKEKPDVILMTGDMIVKNGKGRADCLGLCRSLTKFCTVYYSVGNHESGCDEWEELEDDLTACGVIILDNEKSLIEIGNDSIWIYGLTIPDESYNVFWKRQHVDDEFLEEKLGLPVGHPVLLMAHNPDFFPEYANWGADVVFSGHIHGGIMRFGHRGAIAPSYILFPKYSGGVYTEQNSQMVLSRGLGTHHIKLRFFNNPEICVVTLTQKKG
jgi:predicted MPP superfamily phosphohydrolase